MRENLNTSAQGDKRQEEGEGNRNKLESTEAGGEKETVQKTWGRQFLEGRRSKWNRDRRARKHCK
jgi:hypothetical protein